MGDQLTFYCPRCWKEVPDGAQVCSHCQASLEGITNEKFFDKLIDALRHPVSAQAAFAAQTLGWLGNWRAVEPLLGTLGRTRDPEVQEAVIRSLGMLGDARAVSVLDGFLEDEKMFLTLRIAAVEALGQIGGEQAIAVLNRNASHDDRTVARAAREVLNAIKSKGLIVGDR